MGTMFPTGSLARTTLLSVLFVLVFLAPRTFAQNGACCIGTACTIRTLAACDSAGGEFFGGPCSPNPCTSLAVCCDLSTFGCTLTTSTGCSGLNQRYLPTNTSCSPNPCANLGACCNLTSGTCSLLFSSGCAGSFQGRGTLCTPGLCNGACCNNTSLVCAVTGSGGCAESGGTYLGNTTTCSPDPCFALSGACCNIGNADGGCRLTLPAGCPPGSTGTVFQGVGVTCAPNPCVRTCCFEDSSCTVLGSLVCTLLSGVPSATLTTCSPNPCLGACCDTLNAQCTLTASTGCPTGAYLGNGSVCGASNPCLNLGACCNIGASNGGCRLTLPANCPPGSTGTVFQGVGVTCAPNPCVWACCFGDSSCMVLGSLVCTLLSGVPSATLTTCSPNPCLGACCNNATGQCTLVASNACSGGAYLGNGSRCAPTNACLGVGACCNIGSSDGGCRLTLPANCPPGSTGTVFQGVGVTCAPNPCVRACCFDDSSCSVLGSLVCTLQFGVPQVGVTTCSPNPCLGSIGACCFADSTCSVIGSLSCTGSSGVPQGDSTTCGPTGNPTTCCRANFNQLGGVTVQDIFDFLAAYFASSLAADFNRSGVLSVQDIFDFLAAYFAGCS